MTRTVPLMTSTHPIVGAFFFLGAVALAAAPLPILFRDLGIIFVAYLAFALIRPGVAYMIVILAPPLGLLSGSPDWLIMQPLVISSGLLAMIGLEYGWRYPAIVVSPLLYLLPYLIAGQMSRMELFAVELPFAPSFQAWLTLHGLVALAGVLLALYIDRRRERRRR